MRWDNLRLDSDDSASGDGGQGQLPMFARDAVVRTFDTPGFRDMTFYEVHAKSIVSHVPRVLAHVFPLDDKSLSRMPACLSLLHIGAYADFDGKWDNKTHR